MLFLLFHFVFSFNSSCVFITQVNWLNNMSETFPVQHIATCLTKAKLFVNLIFFMPSAITQLYATSIVWAIRQVIYLFEEFGVDFGYIIPTYLRYLYLYKKNIRTDEYICEKLKCVQSVCSHIKLLQYSLQSYIKMYRVWGRAHAGINFINAWQVLTYIFLAGSV